ncbi:uncharacterized protein LOC18422354 [Amborella trichopoda]|uniref:Uncharacterized protein n=1 Tax=Amborella trichopoda TaxID=13333 RepID=W1NFS1_AMBTC|nr:uncharacterized protein LOC18422354 [Amborella trichopoda]ERM94326.1 hypothetical protein AMTR_s00010p00240020 [Amborella trichopoda]|eukprot:XP_006827089.1 uncharacterized protein LOC18422354 [Amborella trichopoda]
MAKPKSRRGDKRKKNESNSPEELPKRSTKASRGGKRVKAPAAPKPIEEPEIIEDQRNLEDLWKAAFPVGTEWDLLDSVYKTNWNFSNLENAFEANGVLYEKTLYIFGCTEPQMIDFSGTQKIICIPVVVAVVSPFPPSDKIGIKSVQMEGETIVPMKEMKMDWVPYIPFEDRGISVERLKSQIFTLSCTQRRAALKHLKTDRIKKYDYCLPYFYDPRKEDDTELETTVQLMYPMEPPVVCEFDWSFDEVEDFTDDLIKEEKLPEDQKEKFMNYVKEQVREAKKQQREAKEARRKAIEDMSEEKRIGLQNMRFYKFYPVQTPDTPPIPNKCSYINRYYGKAHQVL